MRRLPATPLPAPPDAALLALVKALARKAAQEDDAREQAAAGTGN